VRANRDFRVGDLVAIKGVRSRLNGRRRECGRVASVDDYNQAVIDCGTVVYHVALGKLVLVSRQEERTQP
jgi:hypothetical protein